MAAGIEIFLLVLNIFFLNPLFFFIFNFVI